MNPAKVFNNNQIEKLDKTGFMVENREYSDEEMKHCVTNVTEFIMSHSSKNGDIGRLTLEYDSILKTIANNISL